MQSFMFKFTPYGSMDHLCCVLNIRYSQHVGISVVGRLFVNLCSYQIERPIARQFVVPAGPKDIQ